MITDVRKFEELMKTDAGIQDKLRIAAEEFKGDASDEKAVFEGILLPVAEEAGLSASYEEFQEYMKSLAEGPDKELSMDELSQVAGGKDYADEGIGVCFGIGVGDLFGTTKDYRACEVIGAGLCPSVG